MAGERRDRRGGPLDEMFGMLRWVLTMQFFIAAAALVLLGGWMLVTAALEPNPGGLLAGAAFAGVGVFAWCRARSISRINR